jgi:hypothetical protein
MSDHDLGFGQQRSKLRRIALIVEDRGFERRLTSARIRGATVGQNARETGLSYAPITNSR